MLTYLLSKVSNIKRIQNSLQTFKMEHILKIVIFLINSVLYVRLGSEYATEIFFSLIFFGLVIHSTNFLSSIHYSEAAVQRCSVKNLFWKFFENSQETYTVECYFSTKITALHRGCFPVAFPKMFRTAFLQNTSGLLLLVIDEVFAKVFKNCVP